MRYYSGAGGVTHALLRIVAGFMFMMHGGQKLFGWFGGMGGQGGTAELLSMPGIGGVLELVGGALIIIGLFTRPVAFILSGEMAVAYFMMHVAKGGFWPLQNGGELAALYSFTFLFFAFNGAGPLSIDAARSDRVAEGAVTAEERARARRADIAA
jgi:putative oxidoreductase